MRDDVKFEDQDFDSALCDQYYWDTGKSWFFDKFVSASIIAVNTIL